MTVTSTKSSSKGGSLAGRARAGGESSDEDDKISMASRLDAMMAAEAVVAVSIFFRINVITIVMT